MIYIYLELNLNQGYFVTNCTRNQLIVLRLSRLKTAQVMWNA